MDIILNTIISGLLSNAPMLLTIGAVDITTFLRGYNT